MQNPATIHKPPHVDPLQYAATSARQAMSALLSIPSVFLTHEEDQRFKRMARRFAELAQQLDAEVSADESIGRQRHFDT